jgi:hypothetical protein
VGTPSQLGGRITPVPLDLDIENRLLAHPLEP